MLENTSIQLYSSLCFFSKDIQTKFWYFKGWKQIQILLAAKWTFAFQLSNFNMGTFYDFCCQLSKKLCCTFVRASARCVWKFVWTCECKMFSKVWKDPFMSSKQQLSAASHGERIWAASGIKTTPGNSGSFGNSGNSRPTAMFLLD